MYRDLKPIIDAELQNIREAGLYKEEHPLQSKQGRKIKVDGKELLNFCSNNYLGLSGREELEHASDEALKKWGFGLASVRFICGTQEIHKDLEKRVLHHADQIITTSFTTKREFKEITTTPITVITNGYDVLKIDKPALDENFSLSHIGSLLAGRNPQHLWEALAELVSEDESFAADFKLKLTGAVGEGVLNSIKRAGLEANLELNGYVSHKEAVRLQHSSQMLLLIEIDSEETRGIIPGKLFEYLVTQRPILAVGPENADIQKIITETNSGKFFRYSEKQEIKDYVLSCYRTYKEGKLITFPIGLQKYSRKALTGELAKLLK